MAWESPDEPAPVWFVLLINILHMEFREGFVSIAASAAKKQACSDIRLGVLSINFGVQYRLK
jgi:hypothetical protein